MLMISGGQMQQLLNVIKCCNAQCMCVHILLLYSMLLTLGADAPQGLRYVVGGGGSGSIFPYNNKSAKKTYGSPHCCKRLN